MHTFVLYIDEIALHTTYIIIQQYRMARRSTSTSAGSTEKSPIAVDITPDVNPLGELATDPIPHVKVNNANLSEIKSSLDEAVKRVRPSPFYTIHLT